MHNIPSRLDKLEERAARTRALKQIPSWVAIAPPDPSMVDNKRYFATWEDVQAVYPNYPNKVYKGFDPENDFE